MAQKDLKVKIKLDSAGWDVKKVTRYTRAGVHGKTIICPHCGVRGRVYHFAWYALNCIGCKKDVDKLDWLLKPSAELIEKLKNK